MANETKTKAKKKRTKAQNSDRRRHTLQAIWAFVSNSYLLGFFEGKIYQGTLKTLCVPGLNCYSCPGALGSCPIGAMQAVIGSRNHKFAFYVSGFLIFIGALCGRLVCGFLCPFGFLQDLLHKIPFPKKIKTFKGDKLLRYFKYVVLLVFVILLPLFVVDFMGQGAPYFCKLICPAGMLEGGVPLSILDETIRDTVGFLFAWKGVILAVTVFLSILIYRPFCKYICPLGAIYSVFNPISLYHYSIEKDKCTDCGACAKVCKMGVDPRKTPNSLECIRCGLCKDICPEGAIHADFSLKKDAYKAPKKSFTKSSVPTSIDDKTN